MLGLDAALLTISFHFLRGRERLGAKFGLQHAPVGAAARVSFGASAPGWYLPVSTPRASGE